MNALTIVATPIGNIKDISLRALDTIKEADIILAEDTRHTKNLIKSLAIELKPNCRLLSCDSHKEKLRIDLVLTHLHKQEKIILVSDAGCPTISDPGSLMIQAVIDAGFLINVIPGPSAHSTALMGAGINTTRFVFLGFLPLKKTARQDLLSKNFSNGLALVIYEAPHRLAKLLAELYALLGRKRVVVARELTKIFETFHRGFLGEELNPPLVYKGECVVIVESDANFNIKNIDNNELILFIENKLKDNCKSKEIISALMSEFNMHKNDAYNLVLMVKKSL